jgi:transcriptional regulator with GAF, ATPase, and Fis domain
LGDVIRAGETVFVYREVDLIASVNETADRVARSNLTVLMIGETGTGKEVLARRLHENSGRRGPFVPVNCAALPRTLAAPELFGHTRGAFSGAALPRAGIFQTAHRGTLFLDELTDLPLDLQPLLLRALQEKRIRQVGSDREIPVDVRVLAAAQPRIEDAVRAERFRGDLYARLAQAIIVIPPLRARRANVLGLLGTFAAKVGQPCPVTSDAAEALVRYDWPFNVRELESLVAGHAALDAEKSLGLEYLRHRHPAIAEGFRYEPEGSGSGAVSSSSTPSRKELDDLARKHRGNVSEMAKDLEKPRSQIYRWLRAVGIDVSRMRG